ncbi:alpha/beta fold hydrolase [Sphingomonas koreensis]|nr:alpha/beta fold hydrolase [Sphingomonas koreensis]
MIDASLSPNDAAPQHGPRPLPLFLEMLRSETGDAPDRRAKALAGLAAYQHADRGEARVLPAALQCRGRVTLRDYGGHGRPVVFVPSLINPPFILDLAEDRSLLRWLAGEDFRPLLVDWGTPTPVDRDLDITDHVEQLLLPLLATLDQPPVLIGYCLGGTMALAAASAMPVAGLGLLAAPWHFGGFGVGARREIASLWASAKPACETMGLVPMEVLQSGFWKLDPGRTIAKYESYADLDPDSAAARTFVTLEDWANAGAPLTYAAGAQLFDFFEQDMTGRGAWHVAGRIVDPAALPCATVDFVSRSDRIVPAASAARLPDTRLLGAGHVGMIVGGRAREQLWEPLAGWLSALPAPR